MLFFEVPMLVTINIDGRIAYRLRHYSTQTVLIRQKYMTLTEKTKLFALMAELYRTGSILEEGRQNASTAGILNYPPIGKGYLSLRRLRYSYHHLLNGGKEYSITVEFII